MYLLSRGQFNESEGNLLEAHKMFLERDLPKTCLNTVDPKPLRCWQTVLLQTRASLRSK